MKDYKRTFRRNLRNLIDSKGMNITQGEIAQEIGISPAALTRYLNEDKDIRTDVLIMIADYFNVSVDYLLGRHNGIKDDEKIIVASKETNLSECSINKLKNMEPRKKELLNKIIEHDRSEQILSKIKDFLDLYLEEDDCTNKLNILKALSMESNVKSSDAIIYWTIGDEFPVSNPEEKQEKYYSLTHDGTAFEIMSDIKEVLISIAKNELEKERLGIKEKSQKFIKKIAQGMEAYLSLESEFVDVKIVDGEEIGMLACLRESLKPMVEVYQKIKSAKQDDIR